MLTTSLAELSLAGPRQKRVEGLILEVARSMVTNRVVVESDVWHRRGADDAFVMRVLASLFGRKTWDTEEILGERALPFLRETNRRAHSYASTHGGARYKQAVGQAQGGVFCCLCGARDEPLVVDHILPVNQGGTPDDIRNMQLLCAQCNLGKGALRDQLIPAAVHLNVTADVSAGLRFKVLVLSSTLQDGRYRGACDCGAQPPDVRLRVKPEPEYVAANIANLVITCEECGDG
jgi:5-methylcytosine-specific restriction endonuclease McrA